MAEERIANLMGMAGRVALGPDADLADRYAKLARDVSTKYQTGMGRHGAAVCRGCGGFLSQGRNARVRLRAGNLVTTCLRCGHVRRRGLLLRGAA